MIDQVNEIVTTIARAIEEQAATTGEIRSNVVHAQGFTEVNDCADVIWPPWPKSFTS